MQESQSHAQPLCSCDRVPILSRASLYSRGARHDFRKSIAACSENDATLRESLQQRLDNRHSKPGHQVKLLRHRVVDTVAAGLNVAKTSRAQRIQQWIQERQRLLS